MACLLLLTVASFDGIRAADRTAGGNCHKWVMQKWEQTLLIIHEATQISHSSRLYGQTRTVTGKLKFTLNDV